MVASYPDLIFTLPFGLIVSSSLMLLVANINSATICFYLKRYSRDPDIGKLFENGINFTPFLVMLSPITSSGFIATLRGNTSVSIGRWKLIRGRKVGIVDYLKEHPNLKTWVNVIFNTYLFSIGILLLAMPILLVSAVLGMFYTNG